MRKLTALEMSVCRLLRTGMTNAQIAGTLNTTPSAVKQTLTRAYAAMEVVNRAEMIAVLEADLVPTNHSTVVRIADRVRGELLETIEQHIEGAGHRVKAAKWGSVKHCRAEGAQEALQRLRADLIEAIATGEMGSTT